MGNGYGSNGSVEMDEPSSSLIYEASDPQRISSELARRTDVEFRDFRNQTGQRFDAFERRFVQRTEEEGRRLDTALSNLRDSVTLEGRRIDAALASLRDSLGGSSRRVVFVVVSAFLALAAPIAGGYLTLLIQVSNIGTRLATNGEHNDWQDKYLTDLDRRLRSAELWMERHSGTPEQK